MFQKRFGITHLYVCLQTRTLSLVPDRKPSQPVYLAQRSQKVLLCLILRTEVDKVLGN